MDKDTITIDTPSGEVTINGTALERVISVDVHCGLPDDPNNFITIKMDGIVTFLGAEKVDAPRHRRHLFSRYKLCNPHTRSRKRKERL